MASKIKRRVIAGAVVASVTAVLGSTVVASPAFAEDGGEVRVASGQIVARYENDPALGGIYVSMGNSTGRPATVWWHTGPTTQGEMSVSNGFGFRRSADHIVNITLCVTDTWQCTTG
ncbi:hypothetical protein [Actinoplanes solisilvae]|uniref:hypothetical protein n=1 Tax=Actinoplanes solisilvae TaxID=2486853 RepID=UPI000FDCC7B3|nr:hypothetical protein [Actinoplanes solisilvae]